MTCVSEMTQWCDARCSWGISPAPQSPTLNGRKLFNAIYQKSRHDFTVCWPREKANIRLAGCFRNWATTFVMLSQWWGAQMSAPRTVFGPRNPSNQTVIVGQSHPRPFGPHSVAQYPAQMEEARLRLTRRHFCWCSSPHAERFLAKIGRAGRWRRCLRHKLGGGQRVEGGDGR